MTAPLVISPNDIPNLCLQGEIANLDTLIAKADAAGNYPLAAFLIGQQSDKQRILVYSLLAAGALSAPSFTPAAINALLLPELEAGTATPAQILSGSIANIYYAGTPSINQGPIPL